VIALVLGGARSGKSAYAERMAARLPGPVTYVATADIADPDMAGRVAIHQARRPPEWRTVEALEDLLLSNRPRTEPAKDIAESELSPSLLPSPLPA